MPQICAYLWSSSQNNNTSSEELSMSSSDNSDPHSTHPRTLFSNIFDIILIIIYVLFKIYGIKEYAINLYKSFNLILNPFKIGEYINENTILKTKLCPISHLPYNFDNYGERPMNVTNASNVTNVVSEQGLYCWLYLQSEMDLSGQIVSSSSGVGAGSGPNGPMSAADSGFICPVTMEPLRVGTSGSGVAGSDTIEAKSYLSSSDTNYHIFLM